MATDWIYSYTIAGKKTEVGPVSAADLQALAKSGQLLPSDMVCKAGADKWVAANSVKGLVFPDAKSAATKPPSPEQGTFGSRSRTQSEAPEVHTERGGSVFQKGKQSATGEAQQGAADERPATPGRQLGEEEKDRPRRRLNQEKDEDRPHSRRPDEDQAKDRPALPRRGKDDESPSGRGRPRGEDDEAPPVRRRNEVDQVAEHDVEAHPLDDPERRNSNRYFAIASTVLMVLIVTGLVVVIIVRHERNPSTDGKSPSTVNTDNYERTLDWMAKEVNKRASVDVKKNQIASKQAKNELLAELGKIDGKEQTWKFEVTEVTLDKVSFHNEYVFLDNGTWIPAHKYKLVGKPSKVGEVACFVFAQAKSPDRRNYSDVGTYFEIGNKKLISPDTAKLLAQGDQVIIKGKVHLYQTGSNLRDFELHIVETQIVDTVKSSTASGKRGSKDADALGGCGCGGCCAGGVLMFVVPIVILLLILPLMIAGMWKSFEKAGEPGWPALVPFYNYMIVSKIAGKGEAYALLALIPFVGIFFHIIIVLEFCKKFNKGGGFAAGFILLPPVFWLILGFGRARYIGGSTRLGGRRRRDEEEEEVAERAERHRRRLRDRRHDDEKEE